MQAGAKRSRRATHQLLDVLRVARAKHGTAQGMEARSRVRAHRLFPTSFRVRASLIFPPASSAFHGQHQPQWTLL